VAGLDELADTTWRRSLGMWSRAHIVAEGDVAVPAANVETSGFRCCAGRRSCARRGSRDVWLKSASGGGASGGRCNSPRSIHP
jgi:Na+-transporting NADH:ubiquinone oxidoreductase subunit NqrF